MNDPTPRTLGCGKTIEDLSDYLAADRIPFDSTIETCPECLNALEALARVAQLSRDLIADDIQHLPPPPPNWMDGILTAIRNEVSAGRSLPLRYPDPRVNLTIAEGAVRALIRNIGDRVPGLVIGGCQLDGEAQTPGAPVTVTVTASVRWGTEIPVATELLRDALADALATHTHLNVISIDIHVEDIHGLFAPTDPEPS